MKDFPVDNLDVLALSDLFFEAAETERKLPAAMRKQKMSSWPDYPQEWKAYGYEEFKVRLPRATPQQVDSFDKALLLSIRFMDADDRRMVWAVAHSAAFRERGPKWQQLARLRGLRDGRQIKRRYQDALIRLHYKLKAQDDLILGDYFS